MKIQIYRSMEEAIPFLGHLAAYPGSWTFDIESFDAVEFPSRKPVSTDPCHPDFRVRGIAIALSKDRGAWLDTALLTPDLVSPLALGALRLAFASLALKGAFNGGFDEDGLIVPGWVPIVCNRGRDGMLGLIAIGDGSHAQKGGLTLANAVRTILLHEYQWGDTDKALMRDLPIEQVAEGAVRDACYTHELCDRIDEMATRGEYIQWSEIGRRNAEARQAALAASGEPVPEDDYA